MTGYKPFSRLNDEPMVDELLGDPILQLLMQIDGVEPHKLNSLVEETSAQLEEAC